MNRSRTPDLSVVIPVYNSAEIFPVLHARLTRTLTSFGKTYEIIAVVDGNVDHSADVVAGICVQDEHLRLIELSRNFGEQAATTAGLQYAHGEFVFTMDDDLEDPPEYIPAFVNKAEEGYDVVYGYIKNRHSSPIRKFFYYIFYRFLNLLIENPFPTDAGSFCLMGRQVVDAINAMPENNRYIRGMRAWAGFRQTGLAYEREERYAGKSGYNLRKYFSFAMNAILSFSYKPLQYVTLLGFLFAISAFILGLRLILRKIFGFIEDVPGWTSLMVMITFLGGVQLISVGILGQYIARIYDEVKKRPPYLIKRMVGFPNQHNDGN